MSMEPYMIFVWIGIALIFAVIEGATMGLVTIWFTVGAGASAVAAAFHVSVFIQVTIFIVISVALLIFTRPLLKHKLNVGKEKNNVEQYVGEIAIVLEDIEPFTQGRIRLKGLEWAAVGNEPATSVEKGKEVKVVRIEGVKAIVKTLD